MTDQAGKAATSVALIVYLAAFVVGTIVMSFEMLGSRYLNPYFGSGIYTWAALISTVLAALCVGYFLGGWLADRAPSMTVLGMTVIIGSVYILLVPVFAERMLEMLLNGIDDVRTGSLVASMAILFFPVTFLGMFSPFGIRLLLRNPAHSGRVSGTVYGINTLGSIVGTLGTTFYLIPLMGSRAITITAGIAGIVSGLALIAANRLARAVPAALLAGLLASGSVALAPGSAAGEDLVDMKVREQLLTRKDGQIDHVETTYNDIFVFKEKSELHMAFQLKGWDYTQSTINLTDADDLPLPVARQMTMAVAYPAELKRILMIGLGGGTISTYLGRHIPDVTIDTVEIDPGVITAAKKYFGIRESERVRYLDGDGRVFLNRNKQPFDLILCDAFHGGYIPFHLLTKEFFRLVKRNLTPDGAVAVNIHDGTKLYVSTIMTMRSEFPSVHLYPTGEGEVIAVGTLKPRDRETVVRRANELQVRFKFRFSLPGLIAKPLETLDTSQGVMLTDDFAPADLYNALRTGRQKKKQ
ncbi:spermidine synthase [Pseudorhodoplanes sp.]|uniref:spermidine synthase n=1 Tax=Pseudorhodoplanes sp. TaxID=1934341 RepID=UPI003D0FDBB3